MERRPLAGTTVAVTRATDQASSLADALRELGSEVVAVPTIAVADAADGGAALRAALSGLDRYDWLVVTSTNGADRVASEVTPQALAATGTRVAVIGPGTAEAMATRGFAVDLVPDRFVAEGLLEVFPTAPPDGGAVLLAQAAGARPVLGEGLEAAGWVVDRVEAYRTVHPPVERARARAAVAADIVTFTSASTVSGYVAGVGLDPPPRAVACIGPVTAAAARSQGLEVDVVADPHTIAGLVDAIVAHCDATQA
ncbi:MAG: uroporphyrinogen-III synthase [Acidimicrobiales bacterium]